MSCRVLKHSRVRESRADGVAMDAVLCIFQGYLPGEARDRALGGAVRCWRRQDQYRPLAPGEMEDLRQPNVTIKAMMLEVFMIQPRSPLSWGSWASICLRANLHPRNTDLVFTRIVLSQMSSCVSCSMAGVVASGLMPALFTMLASVYQRPNGLFPHFILVTPAFRDLHI